MYCNIYSVVISNETFFLILAASPWNGYTIRHKNILNCPKSKKRFPFALYSYCHAQDIFKELSKLSKHVTFEGLRITCDCLSFRSCRCPSFRERMFYGYCITFFHANRPITLAHGTNTHSYVIGFCSRLIGLNIY